MQVCVLMHTSVEAQGRSQVSFSKALYLVLRQGLSLNWTLVFSGRLARELSLSACFLPAKLGLHAQAPMPGFSCGC